MPLFPLPRLRFTAVLFSAMALLSCQNSTSPSEQNSQVSGTFSTVLLRSPDSVSWTAEGSNGAFQISGKQVSDTIVTFTVNGTLPSALGSDTLYLNLWTLSLRTTRIPCLSDEKGALSGIPSRVLKDSTAILLLSKFDSLRTKSPSTWGSPSDAFSAQVAALVRAYAQSIFSGDPRFAGFPAKIPVGMDSLAVVRQILLQAAGTGLTAQGLATEFGFRTDSLQSLVRALFKSGLLNDTSSLLPIGLSVSGIPSSMGLVEDSTSRFHLTLTGTTGDTANLRLIPADTSLLGAQTRTLHRDDTLALQPKTHAAGGPTQVLLVLTSGSKTDTLKVSATVASRNQAPSFSGASNLTVKASSDTDSYQNWINGISAGPANESNQTVSFEVQVQSGNSLFAVPPKVDGSGTLTFVGAPSASGTATVQVRAHDNGDSTTGSSKNTSAWKNATIQFVARSVLSLTGLPANLALVEDSNTTVSASAQYLTGTSLSIKYTPNDSTLISTQSWTVKPDSAGKFSFSVQGKTHSFGGPVSGTWSFSDSLDQVSYSVTASLAARNQAPSFSGASNIQVTASSATSSYPAWINGISAGPVSESSQSVSFEVQVLSGADLFSQAPKVDGSGTLTFTGTPGSSGAATIQVRAHDNGDSSTGNSKNASAWKIATIQFTSRPTLAISGTGLADTLHLVEDSTRTVTWTAQYFLGSSLSIHLNSADPTRIANQTWTVTPDNSGKFSVDISTMTDAFGGPVLGALTFLDSLDNTQSFVYLVVAPRNRPPSFSGAAGLVVAASTAPVTQPNWISGITAGPANESSQSVSFEVQVQSNATLFASLPTVDGSGTLSFTGRANSSGTATIQVRAHDNGDSTTGSSRNTSAWKSSSITFNVPPLLNFSSRSDTGWEGIPFASGSVTINDLETSIPNLQLSWSLTDSTLIAHDSLLVGGASGTRNIQVHPVPHRWGTAKVAFKVTDSLGASFTDTLTLVVKAVNHAPSLSLKTASILARTWKGTQAFALANTPVWDDVSNSQTGRVDVSWSNPADSAKYLTSLSVDASGVLHLLASADTTATLTFRVRAHDNAGTANDGVDTSAWSSSITLQLVDTALDGQGNSYRVRRMPDGQTWMRSNLRDSSMGTPTCPNIGCGQGGILYTPLQAFTPTAASNPALFDAPAKGICPTGWHMAAASEWHQLFLVTMPPNGDSTYALRRDSSFTQSGQGGPLPRLTGGNQFGDFIYPNGYFQMYGDEFWMFEPNENFGNTPIIYGFIFRTTNSAPTEAGVRCVLNKN